MILGICGGRDFDNYSLLIKSIESLLHFNKITEIVSGGAIGADSLARLYALSNELELKEFYPDWDKYGKSAGFKRNKQIVDYADMILAFHDGISRGTANTIKLAKQSNKSCTIIYY